MIVKNFLKVMDFAEWLKTNRELKGYSQRRLAKEVDYLCSDAFISQIETRKYVGKKGNPMKPDREIVIALAKALNADVDKALNLAGYASNSAPGFLRRVFNIAVDELDWLIKSPFKRGMKLIHKSAEKERHRVMTFEEEQKLLAQCQKIHRKHLLPYIIIAVDTAMRRSEIYNLRWWQIDFENNVIYLTQEAAKFSKTGAEGILPMTERVFALLKDIQAKNRAFNPKSLVLGKTDFKKSWKAVCVDANVTDLQFRDLRATAVVRMLNAGVSGDLVRKITRHSKDTDIFLKHYTRIDLSNAQNIGKKLQEFNQSQHG